MYEYSQHGIKIGGFFAPQKSAPGECPIARIWNREVLRRQRAACGVVVLPDTSPGGSAALSVLAEGVQPRNELRAINGCKLQGKGRVGIKMLVVANAARWMANGCGWGGTAARTVERTRKRLCGEGEGNGGGGGKAAEVGYRMRKVLWESGAESGRMVIRDQLLSGEGAGDEERPSTGNGGVGRFFADGSPGRRRRVEVGPGARRGDGSDAGNGEHVGEGGGDAPKRARGSVTVGVGGQGKSSGATAHAGSRSRRDSHCTARADLERHGGFAVETVAGVGTRRRRRRLRGILSAAHEVAVRDRYQGVGEAKAHIGDVAEAEYIGGVYQDRIRRCGESGRSDARAVLVAVVP
ncbi:hypothetical protein B0H13DRAFT_1855431 [Mycena leptocephala]|nr:hypothetical protein B0H13DRAFT_1855431 [Mycena leptocephala]